MVGSPSAMASRAIQRVLQQDAVLIACMRTVDGYRNDNVRLAVDEKIKENGTLRHSLLELWENLDGRIEACLRIMDLPDEMREPKWYPIMM